MGAPSISQLIQKRGLLKRNNRPDLPFNLINGGYGTFNEFYFNIGPEKVGENEFHDRTEEQRIEYLKSGARIITLNTFWSSYEKLKRLGKEQRIEEINKTELARTYRAKYEALKSGKDNAQNDIPQRPLVGIPLSPFGECYRTECHQGHPNFVEEHRPTIESFLNANPEHPIDFFLPETQAEISEIVAFYKVIREYFPNTTIVPSLHPSSNNGKAGILAANGLPISDVIDEIEQNVQEPIQILLNCFDMGILPNILNTSNKKFDQIIGMYPNPLKETGFQKNKTHVMNSFTDLQQYALIKIFWDLKENELPNFLIGGICCGSRMDDYKNMNQRINQGKEKLEQDLKKAGVTAKKILGMEE